MLASRVPQFYSCSLHTRPDTQSCGLHQPASAEVRWCGELLPWPWSTQHFFPNQWATCAGDVWEFQHRWTLLPCDELFSWCQVSDGCSFLENSYDPTLKLPCHPCELRNQQFLLRFRLKSQIARKKVMTKGQEATQLIPSTYLLHRFLLQGLSYRLLTVWEIQGTNQ